jgi:Asp-tRNA(Asn)/Glu-tRNA(Gln) amidotransferase A subunit family amidase
MDAVDLAFAGAVRQAEMIRSREISARELTELYLDRIARLDGFPVGAQLVVPRDGEPVLLSVAAQLERALRWAERRPAMAS